MSEEADRLDLRCMSDMFELIRHGEMLYHLGIAKDFECDPSITQGPLLIY